MRIRFSCCLLAFVLAACGTGAPATPAAVAAFYDELQRDLFDHLGEMIEMMESAENEASARTLAGQILQKDKEFRSAYGGREKELDGPIYREARIAIDEKYRARSEALGVRLGAVVAKYPVFDVALDEMGGEARREAIREMDEAIDAALREAAGQR